MTSLKKEGSCSERRISIKGSRNSFTGSVVPYDEWLIQIFSRNILCSLHTVFQIQLYSLITICAFIFRFKLIQIRLSLNLCLDDAFFRSINRMRLKGRDKLRNACGIACGFSLILQAHAVSKGCAMFRLEFFFCDQVSYNKEMTLKYTENYRKKNTRRSLKIRV